MPVTVASFWFPRPAHEQFKDYTPYLEMLDASVKRLGHMHVVITDTISRFDSFRVSVPDNLMQATLKGQLEFLKQAEYPVVLVGADCLVQKDPTPIFDQDADILVTLRKPVTWRGQDMARVNNGAVYLWNRKAAVALYEKAAAMCQEYWGADQQAISDALNPIPESFGVYERNGANVIFASDKIYNATPKTTHFCDAYVIHFKGPRKHLMAPYFHGMDSFNEFRKVNEFGRMQFY